MSQTYTNASLLLLCPYDAEQKTIFYTYKREDCSVEISPITTMAFECHSQTQTHSIAYIRISVYKH